MDARESSANKEIMRVTTAILKGNLGGNKKRKERENWELSVSRLKRKKEGIDTSLH